MSITTKTISISHFSDVLCIWAYVGQIRIDELKSEFTDKVSMDFHFCSVFGNVDSMLDKNWKDKGGLEAYNKHVLSIAEKFEHIEVHKDIWRVNTPKTSTSAHVILKAAQLIDAENALTNEQHSNFEKLMWAIRLAFFRDGIDISDMQFLLELATQHGYTKEQIKEKLFNGSALAALEYDNQLKVEYKVSGSPTFILNEGRQMLYGNVGYRVIEANIKELLANPENQASWC